MLRRRLFQPPPACRSVHAVLLSVRNRQTGGGLEKKKKERVGGERLEKLQQRTSRPDFSPLPPTLQSAVWSKLQRTSSFRVKKGKKGCPSADDSCMVTKFNWHWFGAEGWWGVAAVAVVVGVPDQSGTIVMVLFRGKSPFCPRPFQGDSWLQSG